MFENSDKKQLYCLNPGWLINQYLLDKINT
jgi:hypothetical protein